MGFTKWQWDAARNSNCYFDDEREIYIYENGLELSLDGRS